MLFGFDYVIEDNFDIIMTSKLWDCFFWIMQFEFCFFSMKCFIQCAISYCLRCLYCIFGLFYGFQLVKHLGNQLLDNAEVQILILIISNVAFSSYIHREIFFCTILNEFVEHVDKIKASYERIILGPSQELTLHISTKKLQHKWSQTAELEPI